MHEFLFMIDTPKTFLFFMPNFFHFFKIGLNSFFKDQDFICSDYSGPIKRIEKTLAYLSIENQEFLESQNLDQTSIDSFLDLFKKIDANLFSVPSERIIIHADCHKNNFLFTGLDQLSDLEITQNHGTLTKSDGIRCYILDFELAMEASFIYEIAAFTFFHGGYPNCYEKIPKSPTILRKILTTYLKHLGMECTQDQAENYVSKIPYATLIFSFMDALTQLELNEKVGSPDSKFINSAAMGLISFRKQYYALFGENSPQNISKEQIN